MYTSRSVIPKTCPKTCPKKHTVRQLCLTLYDGWYPPLPCLVTLWVKFTGTVPKIITAFWQSIPSTFEHITHLDNSTELDTLVTVYRHWSRNQYIWGNHSTAHSCMQSGIESQLVLLARYSAWIANLFPALFGYQYFLSAWVALRSSTGNQTGQGKSLAIQAEYPAKSTGCDSIPDCIHECAVLWLPQIYWFRDQCR